MSDGSNKQVKAYNLHTFEDISIDIPSQTVNMIFFDHQGDPVNIMISLSEMDSMGTRIAARCLEIVKSHIGEQ